MDRVVAVVVTYNRKILLDECINAILNQTRKIDKIIIIDNNSSDGTFEMLKSKGYINNSIIEYKKLEKNIGGAGGFFEGIKSAYIQNYNWIWIMDDDTIPKKNTLERLLKAKDNVKGKISFLASSVYGMNNEYMNVPIVDDGITNNGYADWYKYLEFNMVKIKTATFVSLLINREAIKKCGLPLKDYFIWGDDTEYTTRLTKYYGEAFLVGDSQVIHKRKNAKSLSVIEETNKDRLKMYYYNIRNNFVNIKTYSGKFEAFKYVLKNIIMIFKLLFSRQKFKYTKINTIIKGLNDGILKKYDYKAFKDRMKIEKFI